MGGVGDYSGPMNRPCSASSAVTAILLVLAALSIASAVGAEPAGDGDRQWPREFPLADGRTLLVYQPQIEAWPDFKSLEALSAIALETPGEEQPTYGALRLGMATVTDFQSRQVVLQDVTVSEWSFPSLDEEAEATTAKLIQDVFPSGPFTVSLDQMLADVDRLQEQRRETELKHEPPTLRVSRKRAMLVLIDGEPMTEPVPGTELLMVINTPSYLFKQARYKQFYLVCGESWLTSGNLQDRWLADNNLTDEFRKLPGGPEWQGVKARVPGKLLSLDQVPEVFVVPPQTELLALQGEPRLAPIDDTNLSYVLNTESDVFMNNGDGQYYLLISGRWYRAPGIDSPLRFCTNDLPEDFARIPPDHTCGRVRFCVPGTPEAKEAVITAHIPRTIRVKRAGTTLDVSFIGSPRFEPIEGTGVEYAVNTSLDVFRVDGRSLACHDAIWYEAATPAGPWSVCDAVPASIYAIPPSSPKYRVTYVSVDESDADSVVYAYTPGYLGTYVSDGVVVYGTGTAYTLPREYYLHYFQHAELHRNDFLGSLQTFGGGYYYDQLAGRFQRSPAVRTHGASGVQSSGVQLAWSSPAVTVVPYGALTATPAAIEPIGAVRQNAPDIYAGPDGNVYQRRGRSWHYYAGDNWAPVSWAGPAYPPRRSLDTDAMSWTRKPPTQRGLEGDQRSRGLSANRYMNYRDSYGNRTR